MRTIPIHGTPQWLRMFRAFRHYNFRLYFFGLLISLLGAWAQSVAQSWLVYEISRSALVLGKVSFIVAIPVWLAGPWAGVVIDRTTCRSILIVTQSALMLQAFTLAALNFADVIAIWHIMLLATIQGLANAFDAPSRQSIIVELVGKEDLSNGIALNSTMFSLARAFGPAIGGIIVAAMGTAWAFTINGITFLAILASLLLLRLEKPAPRPVSRSPVQDLVIGLRFIWSKPNITALMATALTVALFAASVTVLMPVMAVEVLGKGKVEFGLLNGTYGLGSIIGALMVTYFSSMAGRGRRLNLMNILAPLALLAFSFSRLYPLSLLILVIAGATMIPQLSLCNMLIQSNIPDEFRGRVMSVYTLFIFGTFPLGSLIFGALAEHFGAPAAIAIGAGIVMLLSFTMRLLVPGLKELD